MPSSVRPKGLHVADGSSAPETRSNRLPESATLSTGYLRTMRLIALLLTLGCSATASDEVAPTTAVAAEETRAWTAPAADVRGPDLIRGDAPFLDLSALKTPQLKPADVEGLAGSALLESRRGLRLSGHPLGIVGAKAIAASHHLGRLEVLELDTCGLGDSGARAIGYSHRLGSLRELDLGGNALGAYAVEAIAEADYVGNLVILDIAGARPEPDGARKLGAALAGIEILRIDAELPAEARAALETGLGDRVSALVVE